MDILKFSWVSQNPSEVTKVSTGIQLAIPDLEYAYTCQMSTAFLRRYNLSEEGGMHVMASRTSDRLSCDIS
jgi:hypothetical protein